MTGVLIRRRNVDTETDTHEEKTGIYEPKSKASHR